jgi:glycosyltransferase involved in cell wall biosynthesis
VKNKLKKITILCFVDYYLPGYKAGGPIRSIANLVESLGDELEFNIICNDRDLLDKEPYTNLKIDEWNVVSKAKVFYASKKNFNFKGITKLLNETKYDLLYFNSFFSFKFTILPLIIYKFFFLNKKPCIIAPRGEFSPGALKLKSIKKIIYLYISKLLGLHNNLYWQASSDNEKKDILRNFKITKKPVYIAPDLISYEPIGLNYINSRKSGPLRIIFLSRISPMKNLNFLLRVLQKVNFPIEFSIYGPKDDLSYWKECLYSIDQLPSNIKLLIGGSMPQKQVKSILQKHDVFVLPTLGENFGHIIIEALIAGVPAIISDKTFWEFDEEGALEVLALDEYVWLKTIIKWSKFDDHVLKKKRQAALSYAKNYYNSSLLLKKNKELFYSVFNQIIVT